MVVEVYKCLVKQLKNQQTDTDVSIRNESNDNGIPIKHVTTLFNSVDIGEHEEVVVF